MIHDLTAFAHAHPLITVGGTFAVVVAALRKVVPGLMRTAWGPMRWLLLETHVIESSVKNILVSYLDDCPRARRFGSSEIWYGTDRVFRRGHGNRKFTVLQRYHTTGNIAYLYRGIPVWFRSIPNKNSDGLQAVLQYPRKCVKFEDILHEAARADTERWAAMDQIKKKNRFQIVHIEGNFTNNGDNLAIKTPDDLPKVSYLDTAGSDLFGVPFGEEVLQIPERTATYIILGAEGHEILRHARHWKDNQQWYTERGIPYKLGFLLYGLPGTGKTSLVKTIAEVLDLPVYVFHLRTMNDSDLRKKWIQTHSKNGPVIILIEDVEDVFRGRQPVDGCMLSFDALLNCLDGIDGTEGVITFITTNHVEHVDEALGRPMNDLPSDHRTTRPGRIHMAVKVPATIEHQREVLAHRILRGMDPKIIRTMVQEGVNDTATQFQERCRMAAVAHIWSKVGDKPLDAEGKLR